MPAACGQAEARAIGGIPKSWVPRRGAVGHHSRMYLHTLIACLPQAERAALVQATELRSYRRNDSVLAAGEWTDCIYCVSSGLLHVVAHGCTSSGDVITDFIPQDDFFLGASFSEDRYQVAQTLVAALPSSVYLVPVSEVRRLCASHPGIGQKLLAVAVNRLSAMRGQLRQVSSL